MSANKHTPGPWIFTGAVGFGRMIKAADGSQIAVAYGPDVTPEGDSNARLIAAAPELLAALRAVIKVVDEPDHPRRSEWDGLTAVELARSAIAKAAGVAA